MDTLKKEQEDLLVLLADQDTKIDKYKTKLKELGEQVRPNKFHVEIQNFNQIKCVPYVLNSNFIHMILSRFSTGIISLFMKPVIIIL